MNPAASTIIDRLTASRDALKGLNIGDYALIREARDAMAEAANALDSYAKTVALIEKIDNRVVAVLMWLDERGRNSRSYGSHADAYEIAARRLREAMHDGTPIDDPRHAKSAAHPKADGGSNADGGVQPTT